ncbi:MAG: hypothetical protein ABW110_21010 [Steroidobacteraceae bacterium]
MIQFFAAGHSTGAWNFSQRIFEKFKLSATFTCKIISSALQLRGQFMADDETKAEVPPEVVLAEYPILVDDPETFYSMTDGLRERCPVHRIEAQGGGNYLLALRHTDVKAVLSDHQHDDPFLPSAKNIQNTRSTARSCSRSSRRQP